MPKQGTVANINPHSLYHNFTPLYRSLPTFFARLDWAFLTQHSRKLYHSAEENAVEHFERGFGCGVLDHAASLIRLLMNVLSFALYLLPMSFDHDLAFVPGWFTT